MVWPMKNMPRYMMVYDMGDTVDGIGCDTLEEAIGLAEDTLVQWIVDEQSGWSFDEEGHLTPTADQIERYDSMIYDCTCYVVEWDSEANEYPGIDYAAWTPSDELCEQIGWIPYEDLKRRWES